MDAIRREGKGNTRFEVILSLRLESGFGFFACQNSGVAAFQKRLAWHPLNAAALARGYGRSPAL